MIRASDRGYPSPVIAFLNALFHAPRPRNCVACARNDNHLSVVPVRNLPWDQKIVEQTAAVCCADLNSRPDLRALPVARECWVVTLRASQKLLRTLTSSRTGWVPNPPVSGVPSVSGNASQTLAPRPPARLFVTPPIALIPGSLWTDGLVARSG